LTKHILSGINNRSSPLNKANLNKEVIMPKYTIAKRLIPGSVWSTRQLSAALNTEVMSRPAYPHVVMIAGIYTQAELEEAQYCQMEVLNVNKAVSSNEIWFLPEVQAFIGQTPA
jgi:hypothetical protein